MLRVKFLDQLAECIGAQTELGVVRRRNHLEQEIEKK
jgi:hypothetical protein